MDYNDWKCKPLVIQEPDILIKFYELKEQGGYESDGDFMRYLLNLHELEGGEEYFSKGPEGLGELSLREDYHGGRIDSHYDSITTDMISNIKTEPTCELFEGKVALSEHQLTPHSVFKGLQNDSKLEIVHNLRPFVQSIPKFKDQPSNSDGLLSSMSDFAAPTVIYGDDQAQCDICDLWVIKNRLRKHKLIAHKQELIALRKAKHKDKLSRNQEQDRPNETKVNADLKCNICDRIFTTKSNWVRHMKTCYPGKIRQQKFYSCDTCNESFKTSHGLGQHKLKNHEVDVHKCEVCDKVFSSKAKKILHSARHLTVNKSCLHCGMVLTTKHAFSDHMKQCPKNRSLGDKSTGEILERPDDQHNQQPGDGLEESTTSTSTVDNQQIAPEAERNFKCLICSADFGKNVELAQHKIDSHICLMKYGCDICGEWFQEQSEWQSHMQTHECNQKCHICDRVLATKQGYKTHMVRCAKTDAMAFICKLCPELSFPSAVKLIIHYTEHHPKDTPTDLKEMVKEKFSCYLCKDVIVASSLELIAHFRLKHPEEKPFKCFASGCDEYFMDCQNWSRHRSRRNHYFLQGLMYHCNICPDIAFDSSPKFITHFIKEHDGTVPVDPRDTTLKAYLPNCHVCGGKPKFDSSLELVMHFGKLHPGTQPFKCSVCDEMFDEINDFKEHRSTNKHFEFQCKLCPKTFIAAANLSTHMQTHGGEWFQCDQCPNKYNNKNSLAKHKDVKHNSGELACDICGKRVSTPYTLKCHKKMHGGDLHKCEVCPKIFYTPKSLMNHVKFVHELISKDHCCDVCGKVFPTVRRLNRHREVHNPVAREKNFACDICDKKFDRVGLLNTHVKKHTDGKKYSCEFCGKAYPIPSCLQQHIWGHHTKIRPYKCPECPSDFSYSGALYKHMQLKHKRKKIQHIKLLAS